MSETTTQDAAFWRAIAESDAAEFAIQQPTLEPERPRQSRNGFHALKQSNPKLYRQWKNHIDLCFDKFGHAIQMPSGNIPRCNTLDTLNFWLDARNKPYHKAQKQFARRLNSLSLKAIESHCSKDQTLYYTSNPRTHFALLMLDIDDKEGVAGMDDVLAVHKYLDVIFPNHFNQISTGGKGWHGYIHLQYPNMTVATFRDLVKEVEYAATGDSRQIQGYV